MNCEPVSFNQIWASAVWNVYRSGHQLNSRAGPCKELLGQVIRLEDVNHNVLSHPARKMSIQYACAELLWYLSETDSVEMICAYAPGYKRFAEDSGRAWGQYGYRWKESVSFKRQGGEPSQIDVAISMLKRSPETRQCVVTMWDSGDLVRSLAGDRRDIPCTLSMQFFVRNGRLNCITTMRSNDLWLGMPYDVFCFTSIQKLIADCVGVDYGFYQHQAGSLHAYEKDFEGRFLPAHDAYSTSSAYPATRAPYNWREQVTLATELEQQARLGHALSLGRMSLLHPILHDAVCVCANKWMPTGGLLNNIKTPSIRVMAKEAKETKGANS